MESIIFVRLDLFHWFFNPNERVLSNERVLLEAIDVLLNPIERHSIYHDHYFPVVFSWGFLLVVAPDTVTARGEEMLDVNDAPGLCGRDRRLSLVVCAWIEDPNSFFGCGKSSRTWNGTDQQGFVNVGCIDLWAIWA